MAFVGVLPQRWALGGWNRMSHLEARKLRPSTLTMRMQVRASASRMRRPENVAGNLFVDSSCIDCSTCRWLAPDTFEQVSGQSAVYQQPKDETQLNLALAAVAACPTGSIRSEEDKRAAQNNAIKFPMPVANLMKEHSAPEELRDVYFLGNTCEQTFAASSWVLYLRNAGVAIMVDVPRYSSSFAEHVLEYFGGRNTRWMMVLTHQDDVYNHDKWAKSLRAQRYIHHLEANTYQGTDKCEVQLRTEDFPYLLAAGVQLVHVPGHSHGHLVMFHETSKTLFTGDHLYKRENGSLVPPVAYTWGSWDELKQSIRNTMNIPFLHGFPGHGQHFHFDNDHHRRRELQNVVEVM